MYSISFGTGALNNKGEFIPIANTWDDWHLIPSTRPTIVTPQANLVFVQIPGSTEQIDITNYLRGRPIYGPRTGTLEFYVDNDHEPWTEIRKKIVALLHGKRIKMVLEDDPGFYYEGRFVFNQWRSDESYSFVVINYQLDPFKYSIYKNADPSYDDDIWDTFNFESDIYKSTTCSMRFNTSTRSYEISQQGTDANVVVYKKERITGGLL